MYQREFPDFDYDLAPLLAELPEGWRDMSWHNDTMPMAAPTDEATVRLWFDYADPTKSEHADFRARGQMTRFALDDCDGMPLLTTDDWAEMRDFIKAHAEMLKNWTTGDGGRA